MKKFCIGCMVMLLLFAQTAFAQTPKQVPLIEKEMIPETPTGIHNYLLLCVDSWDGQENNLGNTDGILLVTVDEFANRLILTSFLRDTLMQIGEDRFARLSRFVSNNGSDKEAVDALVDLFGSHFGLNIDNYIVVDWTMIKNIIDAVGGVKLSITDGEAIRLKDKTSYTKTWAEPALAGAGTYNFKGYAAVIYMRIRSSIHVDGEAYDFRRTTRARDVIDSLASSLKDVTYDQALDLLDVVVENTLVTDMSAMDLMDAMMLAFNLRGVEIEQFRIPMDDTYENIKYAGGDCVQVDFITNRVALHDFMYNSFAVRDEE